MTASSWDGVERRASCPDRPRVAIIFDPVEWRRKIHAAPGGPDAPRADAQGNVETQQVDADRIAEQGEQARPPNASDAF